jgi:predicted exporter
VLQALGLIDVRVDLSQATLELDARCAIPTRQAHHSRNIAMQVDHAPATGGRVQPIDVLSDHSG